MVRYALMRLRWHDTTLLIVVLSVGAFAVWGTTRPAESACMIPMAGGCSVRTR